MTSTLQQSYEPINTQKWKNGLWYSYNDFLTQTFGEKVYKVTVSAGFTCPTRDGAKGTSGCAFCDERGSASFFSSGQATLAIENQIQTSMPFVRKRFGAEKFLAYFQSFTNTYGPLTYLKEVYDGALRDPHVVGMAIGTRPDCVPNDVLDLLNNYGRDRYVSLELGLQSFRDDTLLFYDRGHTVDEGIDAVKRALQFPNLNISVHLMFGAPGELESDGDLLKTMVVAAKKLNELKVHGVKIHHLMVLKDTGLAERYKQNPWPFVELSEYNDAAMAFLENLNPNTHVERTHALASHPKELIGPTWSSDRFEPMNQFKHLMTQVKSYQGKHFSVGSV